MSNGTQQTAPVLVPVDFSPCSERALVWAAELARTTGAPMVVLHVIHDPAENPGYYQGQTAGAGMQPLEKAAAAAMVAFLRDVAGRHPGLFEPANIDSRLVVGIPATRILELADTIGARLIVMGSHGRTGLSRMLIGSKAERVVRMSTIPVTIVKSPPDGSTK